MSGIAKAVAVAIGHSGADLSVWDFVLIFVIVFLVGLVIHYISGPH